MLSVMMAEPYPPLVVIVGPTAVGKTAVALEMARQLGGEIISADSRQVYRQMDIGTAKPTPDERAAIPHHLVDVLDPEEHLTLATFQEKAYAAIADVTSRSRLPILAGGTGQYVKAVVEGWGIPRVDPHPALRADLAVYADVYSPTALHDWLRRVDPLAAEMLDYRNVRRVIRALEVLLVSGKPISDHQRKHAPPYRIFQIGLTRSRVALYQRTDQRIDLMIEKGLEEEVRCLVAAGYEWDLPAMAGLGYRQFAAYLAGEATLAETVALIKTETHRFVRNQDTWFRRDDPQINWFDLEIKDTTDVVEAVRNWLESED
jgi:tRNA dimethylallyltransferase